MNIIITFHCLNIDFLKDLLAKLANKSSPEFYLSRNISNNEEYSMKYDYDFLNDELFLKNREKREILCGEETYFVNIKQGLDIPDIRNNLEKKKIVLLNTSIKCKSLLEKEMRNVNFISILIEIKDDNYENNFLDLKRKFTIVEKNKQNHEYSAVISYDGNSEDEKSFYTKITSAINKEIQEKIILKHSNNIWNK